MIKKINKLLARLTKNKREYSRDFLGGPGAKTLCSQCRGLGFDPWSGNQIPHATTKIKGSMCNK